MVARTEGEMSDRDAPSLTFIGDDSEKGTGRW